MAFYDNRGFTGPQRYTDVSQPLMGYGLASYEPVSGLGISYDREAAKYGAMGGCGCSGLGVVSTPGGAAAPSGPPATPSLPFVESDQAANALVQMAVANNRFSTAQLDRTYACTTETLGEQFLKVDVLTETWTKKGLFMVVYIGSEACPGLVFAGLTPAQFVQVTSDVANGKVKAKVYVGALPGGVANTMDNYLAAWKAATAASAGASMTPILIAGAIAIGVFYVASKSTPSTSMVANRRRRRRRLGQGEARHRRPW